MSKIASVIISICLLLILIIPTISYQQERSVSEIEDSIKKLIHDCGELTTNYKYKLSESEGQARAGDIIDQIYKILTRVDIQDDLLIVSKFIQLDNTNRRTKKQWNYNFNNYETVNLKNIDADGIYTTVLKDELGDYPDIYYIYITCKNSTQCIKRVRDGKDMWYLDEISISTCTKKSSTELTRNFRDLIRMLNSSSGPSIASQNDSEALEPDPAQESSDTDTNKSAPWYKELWRDVRSPLD